LPDNQIAFVFPAFPGDYTDHPGKTLPGFEEQFNSLLARAAGFTDPELAGFGFEVCNFLQDELRTQYITYIYSCTISVVFRKAHISPVITAGYSMGIYAALFDAGAISFETGLQLIKYAYISLRASLGKEKYAMGTFIGLSEIDILQLIDQCSLRVEITNQNAAYSFVVSGYQTDIHKLIELAKEEGALHARDLAVSIPYHSSYLKDGATDFADQAGHLTIKAPGFAVISMIDQISLSTPEIIRQEICRNLFQPLNWYKTMQVLLSRNIGTYAECGPSSGLAKNAKFVDGVKFFPLPSILPGS
jgi:malonyl CoA-acyl carrier protein transacylase